MKKFTFFLIALFSTQIFSQITVTKDISFGVDGAFTAELNAESTILGTNIILLPDNSVLYLINGASKNYILKLRQNGTLDPQFANNGMLEFSQNNSFNAVLQGDKMIVYFGPKPFGDNTYQDSKIMRFTHNGQLDTSFANNGILNEVTETLNPQSLSVLVLADQSLVISNSNSTNSKKYSANGQLQTYYGNQGEVVYDYHFPVGQAVNGKITTCDVSSLSSSVYSFFDINSLTTNKILNLDNTVSHQYNGILLQNKTNISTRMTSNGTVYSVFNYQNYPLADFSRLIVIKNEHLDQNFNETGFVSSANDEEFLDSGFANNTFFVLKQKSNQISLNAYSSAGSPMKINNERNFNLNLGHEIEVQDNFILVNSIIPNSSPNQSRVKIEKFITTKQLFTITAAHKIEVENPVKDFLNLKNAENAESFEIYSLDGRKIFASRNFKEIKTGSLSKGNYILKIKMKNGELISEKLLKN